jgi:hypothetical protein
MLTLSTGATGSGAHGYRSWFVEPALMQMPSSPVSMSESWIVMLLPLSTSMPSPFGHWWLPLMFTRAMNTLLHLHPASDQTFRFGMSGWEENECRASKPVAWTSGPHTSHQPWAMMCAGGRVPSGE